LGTRASRGAAKAALRRTPAELESGTAVAERIGTPRRTDESSRLLQPRRH
jgi:hypothetical protein